MASFEDDDMIDYTDDPFSDIEDCQTIITYLAGESGVDTDMLDPFTIGVVLGFFEGVVLGDVEVLFHKRDEDVEIVLKLASGKTKEFQGKSSVLAFARLCAAAGKNAAT